MKVFYCNVSAAHSVTGNLWNRGWLNLNNGVCWTISTIFLISKIKWRIKYGGIVNIWNLFVIILLWIVSPLTTSLTLALRKSPATFFFFLFLFFFWSCTICYSFTQTCFTTHCFMNFITQNVTRGYLISCICIWSKCLQPIFKPFINDKGENNGTYDQLLRHIRG